MHAIYNMNTMYYRHKTITTVYFRVDNMWWRRRWYNNVMEGGLLACREANSLLFRLTMHACELCEERDCFFSIPFTAAAQLIRQQPTNCFLGIAAVPAGPWISWSPWEYRMWRQYVIVVMVYNKKQTCNGDSKKN